MTQLPRRRALALAIAAAFTGLTRPAYAIFGIGDIVFDPTAVANLIKQLSAMAQQYNMLVRQLVQARQTFESIRGVRNFGSLFKALNDPIIYNSLPAEARFAVRETDRLGMEMARLSDNIAKAERLTSTLTSGDFKGNPYAFGRWQSEVKSIAAQQGIGEDLYNNAIVRAKKIQDLFRAIGTAGDLKAIQDLNARIQAEMVAGQNEDRQIQALHMMFEAQRRQQERAAADHLYRTGREGIPKVGFPTVIYRNEP